MGYDNFHEFEKDGGALDYSDVGDIQFDFGDRIKMVTSSVFSSKSVTNTSNMSPTNYTPNIRHQHVNDVGALSHPIVPNIRNHILGFGFDFKFAFD